ncbi:High mobility group B protein 9 [Galdieria sulphuraria]|nr:High mobility group B protein 9 [Galdieria sulphuraria]
MVDSQAVNVFLKPEVTREERIEVGNRVVGTVGTYFISRRGNFKIPTLGGFTLDVFILYQEVVRRGGVQHVIDNREFKEISKILRLPKTCTAAAFVLRESYEKILYFYEQKHVFGRSAEEVPPVVQLGARLERVSSTPRSLNATDTPAYEGSRENSFTNLSMEQPKGFGSELGGAPSVSPNRRHTYVDSNNRNATSSMGWDRTTSYDSLQTSRNLVQEEVFVTSRPLSGSFRTDIGSERNKLVLALQSGIEDEISWALVTINVLSFDPKLDFLIRDYPMLLESLEIILKEYLEDLNGCRTFGLHPDDEDARSSGAKNKMLSAVDINTSNVIAHNNVCNPSLQNYGDLFCTRDPIFLKREWNAKCVANALRNLSFIERNHPSFAKHVSLLRTCISIIVSSEAASQVVYDLSDTLKNIAVEVKLNQDTLFLLDSAIAILYEWEDCTDDTRILKATELIARLCFNPDNELELLKRFDEILSLLVGFLSSENKDIRLVAVGAICNASAFDWNARVAIAKTPSVVYYLTQCLSDPYIAPLSAITIANLAEAPSNRAILLRYESKFVHVAMSNSAASELVACALKELSDD